MQARDDECCGATLWANEWKGDNFKMADMDTSVFEVTIGDSRKPGPHIHFELNLELGGSASADGRAELSGILGSDPEFFVPYVAVQGAGGTHAIDLSTGLQGALETAKSAPPDPTQNALAFVLANAKNDDGDLVTPAVAHQGENAVLTLQPQTAFKEMLSGVMEMASAQAGPLLENKSHFNLTIDLGNTFENIANSNNLVLDLFSSVEFKLELGLVSNIGPVANELVSALGLPPPIRAAIGMATLFKSAEVRTKFTSPDALPESIKSMIPPTDMMMEQKNMLLMMISEADKGLVQLLGEHSTGKATVYVLGPHSYIKLVIGLPGLTKLLS